MSGLSLPVNRPAGRALLVAAPGNRARPVETLRALGFGAAELDDPYTAMAELCRRPLVYRVLILSLAGLYREELTMISAVKGRFPHVEVWLAHTDGRQAALAEGLRLGADGLLSDDGLHRLGSPAAAPAGPTGTTAAAWLAEPADPARHASAEGAPPSPGRHDVGDGPTAAADTSEPILTADELRALLQEQSSVTPEDE